VSANEILQNFLSAENFLEWKWASTRQSTYLVIHKQLRKHKDKPENINTWKNIRIRVNCEEIEPHLNKSSAQQGWPGCAPPRCENEFIVYGIGDMICRRK
jgi:hypothetical protein